VNDTTQVYDFNPGFGPVVNPGDSGNGFGTRVFWTSVIPDGDFQADPDSGTAHLHVQDLQVFEYLAERDNAGNITNGAGNVSLGPNWQTSAANATVSFDVHWDTPMRQVNVHDTANGFAGTFHENQATVTWSARGDSGFSFTSNPGDFTTSQQLAGDPPTHFAQVGHEQNGIFLNAGAVLQPDPVNPGLTDLVVNGSPTGHNDIEIESGQDGNVIDVKVEASKFTFEREFQAAAINRLLVFGGPGDNHIHVDDNVRVPAILMGSDGNDHIEAGGGPSIVIGGLGSDHLEAGSGAAILIGGTTDFDRNVPALDALLAEWARTDESYSQKVANLSNSTVNGVSPNGQGMNGSNFLNATTVHDDGVSNDLEGGPALDWYFASLMDVVHGRKPPEVLTLITV
jgi:hypothetical protein